MEKKCAASRLGPILFNLEDPTTNPMVLNKMLKCLPRNFDGQVDG